LAARKKKEARKARSRKKAAATKSNNHTAANLGFEDKLWQAADKQRAQQAEVLCMDWAA
jgi:predicted alpha-1,6-mannanase (GH76 family)